MSAYWLGVLTLPALALAVGAISSVASWLLWWRGPRDIGKGFTHEFDSREEGRWFAYSMHTHRWPPSTPWWLIRRCEPLRRRLCLRNPDHLPAGESEDQP